MNRIDSRHRKRYTPADRFKIIVHQRTYSLSIEETASLFLVSAQTVARWMAEAVKEPTKKTIGTLLKAVPPLMSYSDILRETVQLMDQAGFGGNLRIAQTLAREGVKLSKETVRRWRKSPRTLRSPQPEPPCAPRTLKASYRNHVWMINITEIPGFLKLFTFKLAVILDVFSRMPLAAQVFTKEPTAAEMASLLDHAVVKHSTPKHFVSDQGAQFTSGVFCNALQTRGIKQRFGAIGKTGSIAIIERFWRTLKDLARLRLAFNLPLAPGDLAHRLQLSFSYYAHSKPHQGLHGATPAELYNGVAPSYLEAKRPARTYEGKTDSQLFRISYLDPERRLPLVTTEKAA
jgi:transposase InsO family protein